MKTEVFEEVLPTLVIQLLGTFQGLIFKGLRHLLCLKRKGGHYQNVCVAVSMMCHTKSLAYHLGVVSIRDLSLSEPAWNSFWHLRMNDEWTNMI